ncbi:MAG: FadR family transcriptional regulator [Chloroflexota bacterium]|nr:FadR family transcriptional regulator [Chloroflexota bacterium]
MDQQLRAVGGRERHAEQIYWAVVNWISATHARQGDRLPNETALAERFRVSRPTMREAIRVLEYSGLVEVRRGRNGGLFVGSGAVPQVVGALRTLLLFDQTSLQDLFDAREVLEVGTVRLAALQITPEHLAILAATIRSMEEDLSVEGVIDANTTFHLAIAEASGNAVLQAMMTALTKLLYEVVRHSANDVRTVGLKLEGHRAIYEALARRDQDAAVSAMRDHIRTMCRNSIAVTDAPTAPNLQTELVGSARG